MNEDSWQKLQDELFPYKSIYLNTAMLAQPMDLAVNATVRNAHRDFTGNWGSPIIGKVADEDFERTRQELEKILNVNNGTISLTQNTSEALDETIANLGLKEGDEVITTDAEYASTRRILDGKTYQSEMTWPAGRELLHKYLFTPNKAGVQGLVVKTISSNDVLKELKKTISKKTKAIVMSHITHDRGQILPVNETCQIARENGVYFILDMAQSFGQIPVDLAKINPHVAVGCGHKWLHAIPGSGIAYYNPQTGKPELDNFHSPFVMGWGISRRSRQELGINPWYDEDYNGLINPLQLLHLGKTLEVHKYVGLEKELERIKKLGEYARVVLKENSLVKIVDSQAPGMIFFRLKDRDQHRVTQTLKKDHNIVVVYKNERDTIRVSISAFNSKTEIDMLGYALEQESKQ